MKQLFRHSSFWVLNCFLVVVWLAGCTPYISAYTPKAYENATALKAETLTLMSKANEPYAFHYKEVETLLLEIDKAYEYSNGLAYNKLSTEQWYLLKDPEGDLLGKFFSKWKKVGNEKLSSAFITEFKLIVEDAFDEIICLEVNKQKLQACKKDAGN